MTEKTISKEAVTEFLVEQMGEISGLSEEQISITTDIDQYGIDSVALVKLIVQIEQRYGVFFEDDEMLAENFENIQVIAERILTKLQHEV